VTAVTTLARHCRAFGLVWVVTLLLGWRALFDTIVLALSNDEYTQILLVLPFSAALIYLQWKSVRGRIAWSYSAGGILVLSSLLIACASAFAAVALTPDEVLSLRMLALVLSWIGAFVLCFGNRASRMVMFPLGFLLALIPLPQASLNFIVASLQHGSAWAAHQMFLAVGVPVAQDGVVLTIPGLSLTVAQECSSIRSSSMLLITTLAVAQLLLRSPWRKLLLVALAIPISVAKNGLRIFTVAMLTTRVDPGYLAGRLHRKGGVLFFMIALFGMFVILWVLRRGEGTGLPSAMAPEKQPLPSSD
jgi:exosortase